MTLTPARLLRSLTTGYPLPKQTTLAADGLPAHILTEPCVVSDVEHFGRLRQTGDGRLRLVWRGKTGDPMLIFQNCRDLCIEHVDLIAEAPTEALVVSERTKTGRGVIPSTMHQWRDVRLYGFVNAKRGFWYRATHDENNEHGRFDSVSVYGCGTCWRFEGQQSKEHCLTLCRAEVFAYAVAADSGFQWIGGTAAAGGIGLALMRAGDPVTIQGVGFETVGVLLHTAGITTAAQPICLTNVRFESDQLAPDGEMIVLRHAGPLVVLGGRYGGGNQPIPRIALRGTGHQYVEFVGRPLFGSFGAFSQSPVIAQNPAEAVVTGEYLAQTFRDSAENTVSVDRATVERISG